MGNKKYVFAVFTSSGSMFYDGSVNELKKVRCTYANKSEYKISPIVKEERLLGKGDIRQILHSMIFKRGGKHGPTS